MRSYHFFILSVRKKTWVSRKKWQICFTLSWSELYYICMTKREIQNLFKAHYTQMYRLAATILYDEDESKDVVSDVFVRLLDKDIALRQDTAEAYLMQATRNRCRNVLERKQVRERFVRLFSAEAVEPSIGSDDRLRMEELMRFIHDQLPPLSQQVFRLRYLQEMTCQEVADALGVSRQTVHTHLQQSIAKIRVFFKSNT